MADIFPTVLARVNAEPPAGIAGRNALTLLEDEAAAWPVLAETSEPAGPRALYLHGLKFLFFADGSTAVFDPVEDPEDANDLVDEVEPDRLFAAARELARLERDNAAFESRLLQQQAELRPEQIEKLRALGYIQS